ncbi:MAG: HK97 family phage prohead protease [Clostridia bacterium]|nr:HK97 family phage prohead protease [Clostridia bacterium]
MPNDIETVTGELPAELLRKMTEGREYRNIPIGNICVRSAEDAQDSYIVEGYATTFGTVYRLCDGRYYKIDETIDPNAFDGCDMTDVIVQYDHHGRVFARTGNGTLHLSVDAKGLKCVIDLGGTTIGRQLYEEIKGGYTTKMSFGFIVAEDQRTETEDHENDVVTILRRITRISKLFDVSAVSLPANDATEISARSYSDGLIAALTEERRKIAENKNKTNTLKLLLEV